MRNRKLRNLLLVGMSLFVTVTVFAGVAKHRRARVPGERGLGAFSFALVGDTAYTDEQIAQFENAIDDMNQDRHLEWVLHAGDIKPGSSRCDDATLLARFDQLQHLSVPLLYTPGDNEWTDCHTNSAGNYYPPERLERLREIFYPRPGYSTGGRTIAVSTQADEAGFGEFVENQLWLRSRVVFSAIHVVGSDNGLRPWTGFDPSDSRSNPRSDRIADFERRLDAALAWLERTFDTAHRNNSPGVFILIHADPRIDLSSGRTGHPGYIDFVEALVDAVLEFDRPVILAHGDTHFFRIDKPLKGPTAAGSFERLEDLTRLETFGPSDAHWVRVIVDPRSRSVFSFEPVIVDANRLER